MIAKFNQIKNEIIGYMNGRILVIYQKLRTKDFASDKKITINLWGEVVKIPINHRLPLYSFLYKNYSTNLRRMSAYINSKYKNFTAIDVGANIGDSAILIRQGSNASIVCVEGDKKYVEILKSNLSKKKKIKIINAFVGEKASTFKGALSKKDGTGYLDTNHAGVKLKIQTLDKIVNTNIGNKIKLLKIDTDGFDGKVIRGALRIILQNNPIIFFEFHESMYASTGDSTYKVLKYLHGMGYGSFLIYDNFGKLLRGLRIKLTLKRYAFDKMFTYVGENYYDIVAFHDSDLDLYRHSLKSERKYFNK